MTDSTGDERGRAATILLIEEDDDTRPILKRNLTGKGYHVIVAIDEEDAFERTRDGAGRADLILLNVVGVSTDAAVEAARRIREHAKYDGHTPIIVMAERYGPSLEGRDVPVGENEYVTYLEDSEQLHRLLAQLLGRVES
ncbi:MAG TPA: hypothetical protein VM934_09015 [Pyrinomonadaceae bacterium]|jgi:DNA-binding response OmpR family regulator|nr:hypothetical protein [Pyrinomonadaceae bacterium]